MRLCFLATEHHALGRGGGIASYLGVLAPELTRLGHDVRIIVKGAQNRSLQLGERLCLHEFRGGQSHWYLSKIPLLGRWLALPVRELEWSWGFYRVFRSLNREDRFDLIEGSETGNFFFTLWARSVPLVVRLHGCTYSFERATKGEVSPGARLDRMLQRISLRRAAAVSAPSAFQARKLEEELGKLHRVTIIPNPVENNEATAKIAGPAGDVGPFVLFAGRLADVKGIRPLLGAFAQVARQRPDVCLVLAGGDHVSVPRREVEAFIEREGLAVQVQFLGHVEHDRVLGYMSACEFLVVPSYYETFCLSAVEAMLRGKPVIGTRDTALEEIVDDRETGLLVPAGDVQTLAEAMLTLLGDTALLARLGAAAREKARQAFQAEGVVRRTLGLYGSVTGVGGES